MARPRKDKFEKSSYAFRKETEHERVYVSSPTFSKVTFKTKVAQDNRGKTYYGTSDQIIRTLYYTNDEIKKLFREKNAEVIKIEKATIQLPNICEKCGRNGVPSIQKKSNYDNRVRTRTNSPSRTNRDDEYWLYYQHTTKRCMIAQYDKNHHLFKNPKNKTIELYKHFFPFYLEKMKIELNTIDFFQKLTNVSHA